jgi:hypothetical protein
VISPLRKSSFLLLGFLAAAVAMASGSQLGAAAGAAEKGLYRAERSAISVSLVRQGRYLKHIRVEALGRCTDGRRTTISYVVTGSGAIETAGNGRFNKTRRNAHEHRVFKGRVEGDVIRGAFRRFYDGSADDGFEPRCGTGTPTSRLIYFVAR